MTDIECIQEIEMCSDSKYGADISKQVEILEKYVGKRINAYRALLTNAWDNAAIHDEICRGNTKYPTHDFIKILLMKVKEIDPEFSLMYKFNKAYIAKEKELGNII